MVKDYIWIYEAVSSETGEVFWVSSRKFLCDFCETYHYKYVQITGYYDETKTFISWG